MQPPASLQNANIAIIGLGYVGLPLAVAFADQYPVTGFDISEKRIGQLREGLDRTREVSREDLLAADNLRLTADVADLADCNVFIVTVPTPIDRHRRPDLGPLISASRTVSQVLKPGDVVVYESTVYPGATEEDCVPVLEQGSGLTFNRDFFAGYSPERINPGDKAHTVRDIIKVTSGSTPEVAEFLDALYASVITAGTHKAASIKVAEAAKVIENTQRDVNIALVNELAMLFGRMGLDTQAVLEAAGTKWNFLPFRPGLVGGHCIGVDPYYLTHKAQEVGHHPEMILAGRRINDNMGRYVATQLLQHMAERGQSIVSARLLVLGLAFKENCPDLRNTRVVDVVDELRNFSAQVDVHDPWVDGAEAEEEYGLSLINELPEGAYDAVVLAVGHREFVALGAEGIRRHMKPNGYLFDLKSVYPRDHVDARL
ncbi:nucleotide sugar dehydrogenase [Aquisalimonas sp. 2447]|uniref:nucleotide sugar dehydrogenase n=1 Tax=Aquisalimonas sp. 2447 TaxID=2740807 RepID=UPI001432643E|nr:nucleotide sugar dehydrogenase [Aquisalimonas sp. 2447]QIT56586.1 nucleotide sugar dehydrogenase [Aquisalimonas sp. 2447]